MSSTQILRAMFSLNGKIQIKGKLDTSWMLWYFFKIFHWCSFSSSSPFRKRILYKKNAKNNSVVKLEIYIGYIPNAKEWISLTFNSCCLMLI